MYLAHMDDAPLKSALPFIPVESPYFPPCGTKIFVLFADDVPH